MPYNESEYEQTLITLLEAEGWQYLLGNSIPRNSKCDVLYIDDMEQFLRKTNPDFTASEILEIIDNVRLIGAESEFATLHKVYNLLVNGVQFTPSDGIARIVSLIDFDNPRNNIFRVVNQFTVEYTNNGQISTRRPDVLLFVNGIPICIIELKNPADEHATIHDAWKQIYYRYWRDIPHLLHYCVLACISDGVKTRLGTVRTSYGHFYAWRRVNEGDKLSTDSFEETVNIIKGVFSPSRLLEIIRDYVYFQDSEYDCDEVEIVCRYPQFFSSRLLKRAIVDSIKRRKNGKGGTYFGATGCGKTYTMAFLARQLSLRSEIGSPTIVMIVDRDDLQKQGAKLFTKSTEFLSVGDVSVVSSRNNLRNELRLRDSGGFYICTIQKFCDRQEDKIGLINERENIICFSDEAHRTQIEHAKQIRLYDEQLVSTKPYSQVLREAFPKATFVGFSGTPISETYQTFGDEIDRYTMDQAVADGLTVTIKYHPRISRVLLDDKKVAEIEEYYKKCADDGATAEDLAASKKAMSSMEIILGEPSRLERLAIDIHDHYTASCANDPERVQKAMIVCSSRKNAYLLLKKFREKYPEWFEKKGSSEMKPMPFIAMISSVSSNDEPEMYNYLGGASNDRRSEEFDAAFKDDRSNFHVAIVVDMWVTGFDVPSLTYMYNDKPLKKHILIQTISRVNRIYPGKEYGLILDYIGIRDNMREAVKLYSGSNSVAYNEDDVKQAEQIFREELLVLTKLFHGYTFTGDNVEKYRLLAQAAEYVFSSTEELKTTNKGGKKVETVTFKTYFLKSVKRMRAAYDICQPSGGLKAEEISLAQCFMAIASMVRKMSGTTELDTEKMNSTVEKMVEEALKYNKVESVLEVGTEEDIFSREYMVALSKVRMPASRLELLIKMLRKQITEYGKTNQIAANKFKDMLEATIREYHERRTHLTLEEAGIAQEDASERIIKDATKQALKILDDMKADRESFRKVGLTFEEKAFYDILIHLRDEYNFEYGEDKGAAVNSKCKSLAKKLKELIDRRSSYSDWLNNQLVRDQLKFDIKVCLIKSGYPPQYSPEVFRKVMEQVENFKKNN